MRQVRTIMITGGAGHLGRAVAARARQQGARLLLLDRDAAALERAYGQAGDATLVAVDLLDRDKTAHSVLSALSQVGQVDVLLPVAGGFRMGEAVHETTATTWDLLMDLNARSLVHVASAVVPPLLLQGCGQIVTVGAGQPCKEAPVGAPTALPRAR